MSLLYAFTQCASLHDAYVAMLRLAIAFAVAMSLLVSVDRLLHVLKYAHLHLHALATGRSPEVGSLNDTDLSVCKAIYRK